MLHLTGLKSHRIWSDSRARAPVIDPGHLERQPAQDTMTPSPWKIRQTMQKRNGRFDRDGLNFEDLSSVSVSETRYERTYSDSRHFTLTRSISYRPDESIGHQLRRPPACSQFATRKRQQSSSNTIDDATHILSLDTKRQECEDYECCQSHRHGERA